MEEMALRWIERVGFPIFCAMLSFWVIYHLFKLFLGKSAALQETLVQHADTVRRLSEGSNHALAQNTLATQELSQTIKKGLNSDGSFCQAHTAILELKREIVERIAIRDCSSIHPDCPLTKINPKQPKQGD